MERSVEADLGSADHQIADPVLEAWRAHAGELVRYATVLVGANEAEDLLVETFLRCTTRLRSRALSNPAGYLFRVLTNLAHDRGRRHAREVRRDVRLTIDSRATYQPVEWDPRVAGAVAALTVRQRAVVYLAYWEDLTESAIADRLGVHVGTVRRHLHRARAQLREVLA